MCVAMSDEEDPVGYSCNRQAGPGLQDEGFGMQPGIP